MVDEPDGAAAVVGASGGIGAALVTILARDPRYGTVHALSRRGEGSSDGRLRAGVIDVTDEASVQAAAAGTPGPLRLVVVATGLLHRPGLDPEKSYRALDPAAMAEAFRVNTIGPALVAKHFLPLMAPRGRTVFAALSARVGSIGDNRLGGWHGYRASKAALNMILRNLALETVRRNPEALCIGLHPGTVDTALSRPFQGHVPEGRLFTPAQAAERLVAVIDRCGPADNGRVLAWDGALVPP